MQALLRRPVPLTVHLRFLQLQQRRTERFEGEGFVDGPELRIDGRRWFAWDEAIEIECSHLLEHDEDTWTLVAEAGEEIERATHGHERRSCRSPGAATLARRGGVFGAAGAHRRLVPADRGDQQSHQLGRARQGSSVAAVPDRHSPDHRGRRVRVGDRSAGQRPGPLPRAAVSIAAGRCSVGEPGEERIVLGSPIILYDYPEIAQESAGSLFDATEIDEILTLRVLTMTEEEKAEARATDPKAAAIIERCDRMTPEELQRLHGVLRDPFGAGPDLFPGPDLFSGSDPFAVGLADDPYAIFDDDHDPETASVLIFGERIGKGSMVRINPQRRADAQDLFYADQLARVVAVHRDLDGETHLAVVLVDDPAAELHDWYGRYLYFAPDELEPVGDTFDEHPHASPPTMEPRKENQK